MAPNYRLKRTKHDPGNKMRDPVNKRRAANKRERRARQAGRKFS